MIQDVAPRPLASLSLETLPRLLGQPERLARALAQLARGDALRALRAPGPSSTATRLVLHRSAEGEVVLSRWSGREIAAPHDHGSASGAMFVVEGTLLETWYRVERGLFRAFARREYGPGALLAIERELIHALSPVGPAVTLHVSAAAGSCMRVFEREPSEQTPDDAGSWIPCDVRLITARCCAGALSRRSPRG
jgi:hypothetical protein